MIRDSGFFYTLPYGHKAKKNSKKVQNPPRARRKYANWSKCYYENGHKAQKKRKKVQNYPEARGKYGAEPVKMDIRTRKAVKKSKIIREPEGNTEPGRRKWT